MAMKHSPDKWTNKQVARLFAAHPRAPQIEFDGVTYVRPEIYAEASEAAHNAADFGANELSEMAAV